MWFDDLRERLTFFRSWVESQGEPPVFWISAFAYPTAFLTAVLQRSARRHEVAFSLAFFVSPLRVQIAIDQLSWDFEVNKGEETSRIDFDDAVSITGLYLEGASWDRQRGTLTEAKSMELLTAMPSIVLKVVEQKKKSLKGSNKMIDR